MKRYIVTAALISALFVVSDARAQLRDVPQPVLDSFKAQYPKAKNVDWTYSIGKPLVEFRVDGKPHKAQYDKEGNREFLEYEILEKELPAEVQDGFKKSKYADWIVKSVYKIEKRDDVVEYRVAVKKSSLSNRNLLFNSEGQLQKDGLSL